MEVRGELTGPEGELMESISQRLLSLLLACLSPATLSLFWVSPATLWFFCISPATLSLVYFASDLVALVRLYFASDLVALVPSGFVSDVPCFCTDAYSDVVAHPVEPQRLSRVISLCTPQEPQLHIAMLSLTPSSLSDPVASSVSALLKSLSCI